MAELYSVSHILDILVSMSPYSSIVATSVKASCSLLLNCCVSSEMATQQVLIRGPPFFLEWCNFLMGKRTLLPIREWSLSQPAL